MIQTLGHYKIVSELGRGGMGVVYKAYEESLNRYVAIKVLGEHLSHDESFVKRFVREAKAAAGLSHPNVIQIFYIGHEAPGQDGGAGRHYFVMEFVEGRSVHDVLEQEGPVEPLRASRFVLQAASGLAVAHDQGLVHRDIKPANLLVTKDERVKIADFGLALAPADGATRLTATNSLMGTPGYLSPEQCCGEPAGPRSDIYSLGMTFYEMLTGVMPFKGESPLAVLRQILDEEPPPLLQVDPDLDPRIAKVVERMVAKEPNDRYQSCHELAGDLNGILGMTGAVAASGIARAAGLPPLPVAAPVSTSARTQAPSSGRAEDAPTQASPLRTGAPAARSAAPGVAAVAGAAGAGAVAATAGGRAPASAPAAGPVAPVAAAATARSGKSGRWILVAALAFMVVVAVSAAGLYFAAPKLMDAPFLRDAPFLKEAAFLKNVGGRAAIEGEATTADAGSSEESSQASSEESAVMAEAPDELGTVETSAGDAPPDAAPEPPSIAGEAQNVSSPQSSVAESKMAAPSMKGPAAAPAAPAPAIATARETEQRAAAPAPPPRAPVRATPRIAVVAVGEPMFAGAAEEALESQLARHGIDLYDERGILELRDAGGAQQVAPSSMLGMVAGRGVDVLVLVEVEPVRERELHALDRYSSAITSRVRVDAYLAADGDAIGRGWSEQVEYTELNAASKADGAMGNVSTAVAEAIDSAWQDHRAGRR